ncbi:MAG TPA: PIN domain-containing protein [Gemmataceae bacterium]|nr:PIN domain-containing protein [Gemmataceae bacterium]
MTFADLVKGDSLFVDANTLLYHCTLDPICGLACTELCQQIGLLTNDAAVVALMLSSGLTKIASNDADFDRVSGLTRYAPV